MLGCNDTLEKGVVQRYRQKTKQTKTKIINRNTFVFDLFLLDDKFYGKKSYLKMFSSIGIPNG